MTIPTFPTLVGLTFPVLRGPLWSTLKHPAASGKEGRLQLWTYPRYRVTLAYDILRSDANVEWQTLMGFLNQVGGAAQIFQFTDPDDGAVTDQQFGTGDGTTTAFQLLRALGGFTEPVFAVSGTPVIKINGTPTLAFTLSTSGVVTFSVAPSNGATLTWTGAYNWLCRFDEDYTEFSKFMYQFWELGQIKLTTEKI